jgi:hypothetical protein
MSYLLLVFVTIPKYHIAMHSLVTGLHSTYFFITLVVTLKFYNFQILICMSPTFEDELSVLFSLVKMSNLYHVTIQYIKHTNYAVAAALHLTQPV